MNIYKIVFPRILSTVEETLPGLKNKVQEKEYWASWSEERVRQFAQGQTRKPKKSQHSNGYQIITHPYTQQAKIWKVATATYEIKGIKNEYNRMCRESDLINGLTSVLKFVEQALTVNDKTIDLREGKLEISLRASGNASFVLAARETMRRTSAHYKLILEDIITADRTVLYKN